MPRGRSTCQIQTETLPDIALAEERTMSGISFPKSLAASNCSFRPICPDVSREFLWIELQRFGPGSVNGGNRR
jgi:hypothetical protein